MVDGVCVVSVGSMSLFRHVTYTTTERTTTTDENDLHDGQCGFSIIPTTCGHSHEGQLVSVFSIVQQSINFKSRPLCILYHRGYAD